MARCPWLWLLYSSFKSFLYINTFKVKYNIGNVQKAIKHLICANIFRWSPVSQIGSWRKIPDIPLHSNTWKSVMVSLKEILSSPGRSGSGPGQRKRSPPWVTIKTRSDSRTIWSDSFQCKGEFMSLYGWVRKKLNSVTLIKDLVLLIMIQFSWFLVQKEQDGHERPSNLRTSPVSSPGDWPESGGCFRLDTPWDRCFILVRPGGSPWRSGIFIMTETNRRKKANI